MILGVDHLAMTATCLDEADHDLVARGFHRVFTAQAVVNHPSKAPLLGRHHPTHDLGFYRPPLGVPIEVTVHGKAPSGRSPFRWTPDLISLGSLDPSADAEFLRSALRFRGEDRLLTLASPIPGWRCTIEVVEDTRTGPLLLDAAGHPCLALLSNSIDDDLVSAIKAGCTDSTGTFCTDLPDRSVRTALFRSPTGTIFELVEINTGATR
jgi:hypothetical protein